MDEVGEEKGGSGRLGRSVRQPRRGFATRSRGRHSLPPSPPARATMASARLLRPALRAVSGGLERRGAKNLGWYYRALERQEELAKVTRLPPFPVETLHGRKRANAFFDVRIGEGDEARRRKIVFELAVRAEWAPADQGRGAGERREGRGSRRALSERRARGGLGGAGSRAVGPSVVG